MYTVCHIHACNSPLFSRYFIVSEDHLKGPVTTVGLAVMPTSPHSEEFVLNLGEVKVNTTPVSYETGCY